MNAREFEKLETRKASEWVMQTLGDLKSRITVLWQAAKHDPEVITARNELMAKAVRIQAASTRWNAKELERAYQALTSSETQISGLETRHLHRGPARRRFDEVIAGYTSLLSKLTAAQAAMKQWSSRLSNLYDNQGSNREFVAGINACRMYAQALEALATKASGIRDTLQDRVESGEAVKKVQDLLTLSQRETDTELERVAVHVKAMQKLAHRYDVKHKTLQSTGVLQRWEPQVQRELSHPHEDEELAEIVESALMFGAPAFPDPATEILAAVRTQHVLADIKQLIAGIMKARLSEINLVLPSVTATVSGVQNQADDLEDQCHAVQSILISGLGDRNTPGYSAARIPEARKLILDATAAALPRYKTKVFAWVKHYVR